MRRKNRNMFFPNNRLRANISVFLQESILYHLLPHSKLKIVFYPSIGLVSYPSYWQIRLIQNLHQTNFQIVYNLRFRTLCHQSKYDFGSASHLVFLPQFPKTGLAPYFCIVLVIALL